MRNLILGMIFGGLAVKLYQSSQARDLLRDEFAASPTTLRQGADSLAATTARTAAKVADVIDAAPVPVQIKDQASQATATLRSVAANIGPKAEPAASGEGQPAPDRA
jgi:hypothetical protein